MALASYFLTMALPKLPREDLESYIKEFWPRVYKKLQAVSDDEKWRKLDVMTCQYTQGCPLEVRYDRWYHALKRMYADNKDEVEF